MRRGIFQAMADPKRRAIITLIVWQAMTPNAIADNFNTSRQAITKDFCILTGCEPGNQRAKRQRKLLFS